MDVFFPDSEPEVRLPPEETALQEGVTMIVRTLRAIRRRDAQMAERVVTDAGSDPERLYRAALLLHGQVLRAELLPGASLASPLERTLHMLLVDGLGLRIGDQLGDKAVAGADVCAIAWYEYLASACALRMPAEGWVSPAAFVQMTYCLDLGLRRLAVQYFSAEDSAVGTALRQRAAALTAYINVHAGKAAPTVADLLTKPDVKPAPKEARMLTNLLAETLSGWPAPSMKPASRGEVPHEQEETEAEEEEDPMQLGRRLETRAEDYDSES
jgi:hypothetical protein